MKFFTFSIPRFLAIMIKEFIQLKRDRLTFAMIVAIPVMQLILFGYAINTNPKHLPTAVLNAEQSDFTRAFANGLINTDYFQIDSTITTEKAAEKLLATSQLQFIINFPPDFTRRLIRGERPQLSVEADATDPVASGSAIAAIQNLSRTIFNPLLIGGLEPLRQSLPPIDLVVHEKYNPENITQYNIVPGLLGVVLTMTLVIITSMCITKEHERGTMENLLATPVQPLEVMLGKILPYVIVGYIQVALILTASRYLFHIPLEGNVVLLLIAALPFIAANLSMGLTFSSLAKTQLQASQMSVFFFLPSLLLSGFMFPFRGMPIWAQDVGSLLPLTYFLRIVRGIVLKGNDFSLIWPDLWPIMLFMIGALWVGLKRFRRTLD
jgi:ABC-2 type transport system permease protein